MKFIADFHIHSHHSIATSKDLMPEYLDYWGGIKGIKVIGTGDFTHPGWLKELDEKLEPAEPGLFRLKKEYKKERLHGCEDDVRFMLTSEISSIYKKYDKVRKVHNVIFAPDFQIVQDIQNKLAKIGNISSDGRPILGIDSRDLLEIALSASEDIFFVPAHIWTPWFSVLGAKSGFDTIQECYQDLTKYIHAVETGLSSDPAMNWMCSFLDDYTLISNSDAHSPEKLGREANIFDTDLNYTAIINAMKSRYPEQFLGTVEFFPQEGKYHYDGHRKCRIVWNPIETLKHKGNCPVCGKAVTVGVMNRVSQLSDRKDVSEKIDKVPYYSLIPLKEILSEIFKVGPNTKQVTQAYNKLVQKFGSEFNILLNLSLNEIKENTNEIITEAIRRMRSGEVYIREGYDGEYGQIKVYRENEQHQLDSQANLFAEMLKEPASHYGASKKMSYNLEEYRRIEKLHSQSIEVIEDTKKEKISTEKDNFLSNLNKEQQEATRHYKGPALMIAGPGTGKTRVLTYRIAYMVNNLKIDPEQILAVTFTNKAAKEMQERLSNLIHDKALFEKIQIATFHALGYSILKKHFDKVGRNQNFTIIDELEKEFLLKDELKSSNTEVKQLTTFFTEFKQNMKTVAEITDEQQSRLFAKYLEVLQHHNLFDLDDMIYLTVHLLKENEEIGYYYQNRYKWILVDEYQDINFAQYQMVRILAPNKNSNLCVIGDPNQAIYGFRGADVRFINDFIKDFPETKIYKLKKSYRCTNYILRASKEVMEDDKIEDHHFLEGLEQGVKINISPHGSDKSEAEFIARTIEGLVGGLRFFSMDSDITTGETSSEINSLADIVVLCRINRQMDVLEKAFNDHSIPYQKIDEHPFYRLEPVRSVINVLKLLVSPENEYLRMSLINKKIINQETLTKLAGQYQTIPITETIRLICDNLSNIDFSSGEQRLKQLMNVADTYGEDLGEFLKVIALGRSIDNYHIDIEAVTLMTLHAAKGLEFGCVFIAGCEDGLIPYSLYQNQQSDPEEERRLLYVGMTRAKKLLFISYAQKRFLMGKDYYLQKSPFLNRIEKDLIELSKSTYQKKQKKDDNQLSLF